ncbi:MAG: hypothetical protein EOM23_08730 [Candidatus Moranbacteria bacterium]|nr:hypothetical protein [Candidatus Moranbacteria bacterium]
MLKDIKIKATNGKTKYVGRFENIAAMAEHFKKDLSGANLSRANMTGADMTCANITGANIDFSSWPLHCGSFKAIVDRKQKTKLLEHALRLIEYNKGDEDLKQILDLDFVKKARSEFHQK